MTLKVRISFALACALFILCVLPLIAHGQTAAELQAQIDASTAEIERLDKEIAEYQSQLNLTTAQKNTLQNKIKQLDLQRKQLQTSISKTRNQINSTQLQIKQLSGTISEKEATIGDFRASLSESLRRLNEMDTQPLALTILSAGSLSDAWQDVDVIGVVQEAVQEDIALLREQKESLNESKSAAEQKKSQLSVQQSTLTSQQGSLDATRRTQNDLLSQTKEQESTYQSILAQKQAEKDAFEAALFELASKLDYVLDPTKVPAAGKGVLRWPLESVVITQQFGRTSDSGRLYKSGTHDGIDLRASIGTPVKAALTGTVVETNLGAVRNCQYGKWVLIRHGNGLTTMYAHLSEVSVSKGQTVSTGSVIGYAGDTGYATGPHLHFIVYASDAVTFKTYTCKSGRSTLIPIANPSAYFNPLSYL